MIIGKVPFEDIRVDPKDFEEFRKKTPLGSLPVAEIDGKMVAQSNALLRYFGHLAGLYPKDAFQALLVDQIIDTIIDFNNALSNSGGSTPEEKTIARNETIKIAGERYFGGAQRMIEQIHSGDGKFIFGEKPTTADVAIAGMYLFMRTGFIDYVSYDALDGYTRMKEIFEAVVRIEEVQHYLEQHPVPHVYE